MPQEPNSLSWESIEQHADFPSFDHDTRKKMRADYFDTYMAPHNDFKSLDQPTQQRARADWNDMEPKVLPAERAKTDASIKASGGDMITGAKRGLQNLQAMNYGAAALAGKGLEKIGFEDAGQAVQDFGMEGYRRNVEEAKQFPKRHSFKDVYTGEAGIGGAIDWAQGTLGELVPTMAEAAVGALVGASVGSAAAPGAGTIGGAAVGGFAGRTILKKAINEGVERAIKKGIGNVTEAQIRSRVTKQALKKLGGKVGMGAAVMPMESGGMYAELLEDKGIDAPGTALFFGALATSMEYFGGNSKLIDIFVDALSTGSKGLAKKTAKELLTNIPQEALQEGGQEALGILNKVVNTDEEFFTAENMEQIIEGMGAGAVGGGAGAVVSSSLNAQADVDIDPVSEKFENIKSQGRDKIPASINELDRQIIQNNQLLQDKETLVAVAAEAGMELEGITQHIEHQNELNQELKTRLQTELDSPEQVVDEPTEAIDVDTLLDQQRAKDTAQTKQENAEMYQLDERIERVRNTFIQSNNPERKEKLGTHLTSLVNKKKELMGITNSPDQSFEATPQTPPDEKQAMYEDVFGSIGIANEITNDAQAAAKMFEENLKEDLVTQAGAPYKNRTVLEKIIAERAYPENYGIIEVDGGFVGYKKTDSTPEMRGELEASVEADASTFKDEQPLEQSSPVEQLSEVEQQLQVNEQQLDALVVAINAETDPDAKLALQQEGAALYAQNTLLKDQLAKQVREDVTLPDAGAEASFDPQFQVSEDRTYGAYTKYVDQVPVDVLSRYMEYDRKNNEKYPGHYQEVRDQIKKDGYIKEPLIISYSTEDGTALLVEGNTRLAVAKELGISELPVRVLRSRKVSNGVKTPKDARETFPNQEGFTKIPEDFNPAVIGIGTGAEFETRDDQQAGNQLGLDEISGMFPNQEVTQAEDGKISVRFKNGEGITFQSIQEAGQGFVRMAIETGQMSKNGKILGITVGSDVLLDADFADNKTMWHENKHVLDNLGMITDADDSMLNKEFNRLRKAGKLKFALSTHEDPKQRMIENRANMFAQIMTDRAAYRDKPLGTMIQRVMDFFQQMLAFGNQSVAGLARETESGALYDREAVKDVQDAKTTDLQTGELKYSVADQVLAGLINKKTATNTPEFAEWFEQSKAKTKTGEPLIFYHGTDGVFDTFTKEQDAKSGHASAGLGHFFTMKKGLAGKYGQHVMPLYLKIQNPYKMSLAESQSFANTAASAARQEELKAEGYDSVIIETGADPYVITFDSGQAKSIHNQGEWKDPSDVYFETREQQAGGMSRRTFIKTSAALGAWAAGGSKVHAAVVPKNTLQEVINTNDLEGSLQWVADNSPNTRTRKLAKDLLEIVPFDKVSLKADNRNMNALGVAALNRKEGTTEISLFQDGMTEETLLHEAIHAAVTSRYDMLRYYLPNSVKGKVFSKHQADDTLQEYRKVWHEFGSLIKKEYIDKGKQKDIPVWLSEPYSDPDEFLTYALTSPKMQKWMQSRKYNGVTLWDRFKYSVKKILGISYKTKTKEATWLDASLLIGDDVIQAMKKDKADFVASGKLLAAKERQSGTSQQKNSNYSSAQFQVAEQPVQKTSEATYLKNFNEKNNVLQNLKQLLKIRGKDFALLSDKLLGSISTRLGNASPLLKAKMRKLDFDTSQSIIDSLHIAKPLLLKTKEMSAYDKHAWDAARKDADTGKVQQIAQKYGMQEDMEKMRERLNKIRKDAVDVGYDVGFIDEYWPRIIKDQEGFLQATQGISERPEFTDALKVKADKMGITLEELNAKFPEVRADVISNMILGRGKGLGGPGNIQGRKYETIPQELEKFYMNSDAALMQYIFSMTKKIEARKFFGKVPPKIQGHKNAITKAQAELSKIEAQADQYADNPEVATIMEDRIIELNDRIALNEEKLNKYKEQRDYTENIGAYVDELMISGELNKKDERVVRDILEARFNEHGTTGAVNAYKNMAYIDVMGNPISALTQIGDLAWAAYVGKAWTPKGFSNTVKNATNAVLNKSKVTKEDLGLERIAQEFADGTTLGNAVSNVFKMVGLTKMDSIGKETLINNALMNYQDQVKTDAGKKALEKKIRPIFGVKTNQVIQDLAAGNTTDNVKMLLYSRLLDFQPAALSEMPEMYLKGGNGRVFYMLKTYTLKQMDVFRNEVFHDIKSDDPKRVVQGIKNMTALISMLTLANAGADEIKDLVLGKEVKFKDNVIENFLSLGGASKYMQMQVTREGVGSAFAQKILPPMKFVNAASQDVRERIATGDVADGGRLLESVPGIGKLAHWHFGKGDKNKKTIAEKDFKKASKKIKKFKQQAEKSGDMRLFFQTNSAEFKQMQLHQKFQSALNRNKATMNKLEKLEQTPAVTKRLGQFAEQRRTFLDSYFDEAENLAVL